MKLKAEAEHEARLAAERLGLPFLVYRDGEGRQRIHPLDRGRRSVTIGRRDEADISLPWDPECSRLHAELERTVRSLHNLNLQRCDRVTMAHGLEARVPFLDHEFVETMGACPPEYKLADGGKGVLKAIGRRIIPPEVIDRPKGYFPVPAITHLEGKVLDLVRDALASEAARERGLFRPEYVEGLLADPNGELTPLKGNKLWQLGLLEMWLQKMENVSR